MKTFEIIDISADAGIRAYGETLEDLFANAATGMYSLITEPGGIREEQDIKIDLESHSVEGLLVAWLNELIFHFDTYGFIGKKINITEITPSPVSSTGQALSLAPGGEGLGEGEACRLGAVVSGEDFDTERHERKLLIKAATYHQMKVEKEDGLWVTNVIFDI